MSLLKTLQRYYLARVLVAITLYYLTSKVGLLLSNGSGFAALVWPPAGISIVLMLYFGIRIWPGIYLGALLTSVPHLGTLIADPDGVTLHPQAFFIAAGATLQASVAVWVVEKYNLFNHNFSNPKKITGFYLVVGPLCSLISATVALVTFVSFDMRSFNSAGEEWLLWYFADSSSAIIFTTLIFNLIKFKKKNKRKQLVSFFIVVGLVLAYSILYLGKSWEEERLELIFNQRVIAATDTLNQFIAAHVSLDKNLKGFKDSRPKLTKDQFKQFAENNIVENGNVRTLAWIETISGDQRAEFEQELASIHGQSFSLWQTGTDMKPNLAKLADKYTVVKLIEPFDSFSFVVGHVIGVDEARNQAMQSALITGEATVSAPVVLITNPTVPTAATIYRAHMLDGELDGFTAVAMRINTMVSRLQGVDEHQSFYVDLYDKEEGPNLTFKSYVGKDIDFEGLKHQTIEVPILNRTWVITFTRTPAFTENNKTSQPLFIAVAGMIFASLVTVGIVLISGQSIFLEKIVHQRTRELEKANLAKTEFMANMSHDLRTPLNAIIGFSEIMTKEMFGELGSKKYLEYSKDINQSSEYLLSLINDILDLSAIDADHRVLDRQEIDLKALVDKCSRTLAPLIKEKKQSFTIEIDSDFPDVYADDRSLKQILINLISNSIKFTPEGGTIKVSAEYSPSQVWITVSDSGQGIAKKNLKSIVDPFSRVDNHPHITQEGTGLGLAIVNSLVNLHGGKLTIKSEPEKGTQISVELPRI